VRCPNCGKRLETEAKLCPNCNRAVVASTHRSSGDSPYADVLKPRSTVDVRGLGSKMAGRSNVTAVRHKITDSDKSESSQIIRCMTCSAINDKSDHICRNCGARIAS
jgi:rRNA maturation endonuclease Nob1